MTAKTLVILAAGLGSRYGGLKQLEAVSAGGAIIADFSVYDAKRAGFDSAVFVIKKENERDFYERVIAPMSKHFSVDYAFQEITDLPEGFAAPEDRTKPWGTGHAVYAARHKITGNFAVINADDFYGADTFAKLSGFLSETGSGKHCMVGFLLKNTVTEHGSVCRGVCSAMDAFLVSIKETTGIKILNNEIITEDTDGGFTRLDKNAVVSMNAWGFHQSALKLIEDSFTEFLNTDINTPTKEFYLPSAVMYMIKNGDTVTVLESGEKWYGMTYKDDAPVIKEAAARMEQAGVYPHKLWM